MRKPSIQDLVYQRTHPRPKQSDPVSFYAHVQRHIVPEVRIEVQTFYGALDTLEAQYPGLDYTYPPHRRRLSRYPWHKRLFRVFDELGLTNNEILTLCQWEGTRAAKERYERESHTEVKATTANDVMVLPAGRGPRAQFEDWSKRRSEQEESDLPVERAERKQAPDESGEQSDEDETDATSVGVQLNEQLRVAAEARARGEPAVFDEQWEQWLKEALERNELDLDTMLTAIRAGQPFPTSSATERRQEPLPAYSREVVTPTLSPSAALARAHPSPTYDELHSMLDELQSNNSRLAADNAALALFLSRNRAEAAR